MPKGCPVHNETDAARNASAYADAMPEQCDSDAQAMPNDARGRGRGRGRELPTNSPSIQRHQSDARDHHDGRTACDDNTCPDHTDGDHIHFGGPAPHYGTAWIDAVQSPVQPVDTEQRPEPFGPSLLPAIVDAAARADLVERACVVLHEAMTDGLLWPDAVPAWQDELRSAVGQLLTWFVAEFGGRGEAVSVDDDHELGEVETDPHGLVFSAAVDGRRLYFVPDVQDELELRRQAILRLAGKLDAASLRHATLRSALSVLRAWPDGVTGKRMVDAEDLAQLLAIDAKAARS